MTEAAAIAMHAEIVGMRNVDTHKSAVLTVHIPQELAAKFVDQFGWPTKVDPIPIAIARLNLEDDPNREADTSIFEVLKPASATKPKREMTLASRISIICNRRDFNLFLSDKYYDHPFWDDMPENLNDSEESAYFVRKWCEVKSRSEIEYDKPPALRWKQLYTEYEAWLEKQS